MAPRRRHLVDDTFLGALETLDLYIRTVMNGRFGGARKSRSLGGTAEFADYREYTPGDDLRRIDWNLAARTEKYYLKQFLDERQQEAHIYLDTSASMEGEDGLKGLTALRVAAALGWLSVRSMDRVCFRALSGGQCIDLCGVVHGRERFFAAMEQLEEVNFSGDCDLCAALMDDRSPGYDNGMSIIVSDLLTDSSWHDAAAALRARKREVAVVRVLDAGELQPGYYGPLSLLDAEREGAEGYRLEVDREAIRAYHQALTALTEEDSGWCQAHGIVYMEAAAGESVEQLILRRGVAAELIR